MNRIALFVVLALTGPAWAQTTPVKALPLYDAFQSFCVKTDGSIESVEKAVTQAGGVRHQATPSEQQFPLTKDQTRSQWDVTLAGHALIVLAVNNKKYGLMILPNPTTSCLVMSRTNEDDSIAAITTWVGVPPAANNFSGLVQLFQYEQQGDHRTALQMEKSNHDAALKSMKVITGGHFWTLTMTGGADGASVALVHVLATPPQENATPH